MVAFTYSFMNITAAIAGPGGAFPLGNGEGVAEEGITIAFIEDKDRLLTGADGVPMHSLMAGKAARITVRLLKTSLANGRLAALYNFQQLSAQNWGQNTIMITDVARGDVASCQVCAFSKFPDNRYGKEANIVEWEFLSGITDVILAITDPT